MKDHEELEKAEIMVSQIEDQNIQNKKLIEDLHNFIEKMKADGNNLLKSLEIKVSYLK